MSTATRSRTASQRATDAAKRVAAQLGLEDVKLVTAALLEVAADIVENDATARSDVKSIYQELVVSTQARPPKVVQPAVELVPLRRIEAHEINIAAPLNPYFLLELYGPNQLSAALNRYPKKKLLEGVEAVQKRHPNAKPRAKSTSAQLVEFIVQQVTRGQ
jgi:hypothetical protein